MTTRKQKCASVLLLLLEDEEKGKRRKWMKEWYKRRSEDNHVLLLNEIRTTDPEDFKNYYRMDDASFNLLLKEVKPLITKQDTRMRSPISPEERLAVTIRYLATGRSFDDLKFSTRISPQALRIIISETCHAICTTLKSKYMKMPATAKEWTERTQEFFKKWNFPNCGGAVEGKHIRIVQPRNSGSFYYNYKQFYSIVLMAVVDANYNFIYVDIGTNGRVSDGGVFEATSFYKKLSTKSLNLPNNTETWDNMNFVFVADDAFPLQEHILKPYAQKQLTYEKKIFNYRLSRARRIVENAFGILASRFRIFHTEIALPPEKVDVIVMATYLLHNFLRANSKSTYIPSDYLGREDVDNGCILPGQWRQNGNLCGLQAGLTRNSTTVAKINRDQYMEFFNGVGSANWQNNRVNKGNL